jgi:protein TonB
MFAQLFNQKTYRDMRKNSDTLTVWLFIAAVIHAIVLMGIHFDNPTPRINHKTVEVTLVNSIAKKAPKNAKYFAQHHQFGAGSEDQKPTAIAGKTPNNGTDNQKQRETKATEIEAAIQHRLITQKDKHKKQNTLHQKQDSEAGHESEAQPELSLEELDRQIAQLEAKLKQQKRNAEKTRTKSIDAISAHKYVAAQYIKDWEIKVERIGNLNYPAQINGKQDFSGSLVMDLGVNSNGSIYNIKVVKSSGNLALDEAAKRIVRISAPFAPLPEALKEELDVLRIRRVWSFSEENNSLTFEQ